MERNIGEYPSGDHLQDGYAISEVEKNTARLLEKENKKLNLIISKIDGNQELTGEDLMIIYRIDIDGTHRLLENPLREKVMAGRDPVKDFNAIFEGIDHIRGELDLYFILQEAEGLDLPENVDGNVCLDNIWTTKGIKWPKNIRGNFRLNHIRYYEDLDLSGINIEGDVFLGSPNSSEGLKSPKNIDGDFYLGVFSLSEDYQSPETIRGDYVLRNLRSAEKLDLSKTNIGGMIRLDSVSEAEKEELRKKYPGLNIK